MKRNIAPLTMVAILIVLGYFLLFGEDSLITSIQRKAVKDVLADINKAPDFTLTGIDDSLYTLSKMDGEVVLLNFWATWCGPCRMEIPEFNELMKNYSEKGFNILGLSVSDNEKQLKNFVKSFKVDYPLLYGNTREMNKVMKAYGGVYAVPSSFLIGKNGNIIWSYPGAILKNYDPQLFAGLVYEIEKELKSEKPSSTKN